MTEPPDGLPTYRVLTGPDDDNFCKRVSHALSLGYELHDGPTLTFDGENVIVAQALLWPSVRLDDRVAARLKVQAAQNGRSMEAEGRAILTDAVTAQEGEELNLTQTIGRRFSAIGGLEVHIPPRSDLPRAADLP